ncbi:MAG TPA: low temperature requirement protein A [Solirubrobacteraceae bacterium]|nr:low temperature requirement protein A [Solirubrobacteraceae bacterium]
MSTSHAEIESDQPVTPLELFFDLVLVFAITQVTGFIGADPTWTRLVEGLAILAVLWWAWVSFAWLANSAASDEGAVRVVLLAAMGALLVVSLAVPQAFGDDALAFGIAYLCVRLLHLGAYLVVARDDPELRGVVLRLAGPVLPAVALIAAAGLVGGTARGVCWALALTIDYGGLALRGVEGWKVEPAHFAERHGLIIIIALGESIVALGVGAQGLPLGAELIAAALLGIAAAGAMWWAYFDVAAIVAERRFKAMERGAQVRMARDSYTYLHMPMVAGIVVFAVGLKKTLGHVDEHLHTVEAFALCGGLALYLLALSAFKRRNVGSWNARRALVAALLLAFWPLATQLPALAALAVVAALACGLIAWEALGLAEARDRVRHAGHDLGGRT